MEDIYWSIINTDHTYSTQYEPGEIHIYGAIEIFGRMITGARIILLEKIKNILTLGWFPTRLKIGDDYE